MNPPSYCEAVAEDHLLENSTIYYRVYFAYPAPGDINFMCMNAKGETFENQKCTVLEVFGEQINLLNSIIMMRGEQNWGDRVQRLVQIIDKLVKYFGPMKLISGTVNSRM